METIVVGYDGTEQAEHALARAGELAQALATKLVVVSVGRPRRVIAAEPVIAPTVPTAAAQGALVTPRPGPVPILEGPEEPDEAALLLEDAHRFLAPRGIAADFVSQTGDPVERLLDVADAHHADLLVVGSREHGFLERLLGGGVDERLARQAHCDVLLVH
jgi:nucleotide-binding universal stress UspA family protein